MQVEKPFQFLHTSIVLDCFQDNLFTFYEKKKYVNPEIRMYDFGPACIMEGASRFKASTKAPELHIVEGNPTNVKLTKGSSLWDFDDEAGDEEEYYNSYEL